MRTSTKIGKLLLATTNAGKAKEIQSYLEDLPIEILTLKEIRIESVHPEEGKTFLENARGKSLFYSLQSRYLTLAEDSGLEVNRLNGAPGVFSARFSGPKATDKKNNQKVLSLMKGVPFPERRARFVCCLVLCQKGKIIKEITGNARGYIAGQEKGTHGFGYDPIFFYPPLNKTFAELPPQEKNKVSHRGRALKKIKAFLNIYFSSQESRLR
ncbi:MAG: RdgB/HAM1 family non-canonical purine NTP pyrophosphatase [Candidatus Aminicenantales bacterium]